MAGDADEHPQMGRESVPDALFFLLVEALQSQSPCSNVCLAVGNVRTN